MCAFKCHVLKITDNMCKLLNYSFSEILWSLLPAWRIYKCTRLKISTRASRSSKCIVLIFETGLTCHGTRLLFVRLPNCIFLAIEDEMSFSIYVFFCLTSHFDAKQSSGDFFVIAEIM